MSERTIFLTYDVGGELTNAHIVLLASSNGAYGIKDVATDEVIIPNGSVVDNPSAGRYEYTFDAEDSRTYAVSWEIIVIEGDEPVYEEQRIGPFLDEDISAVTDSRGTFVQGTFTSLIVQITRFNGTAIDPESISYFIYDEDSLLVKSGVPEKFKVGGYVFDWHIDADQPSGAYTVEWIYTFRGCSKREVQAIVVVADSDDTSLFSGKVLLMRQSLSLMIQSAQMIPVYFQQAQPTADRKTFRFTKSNWNQIAGTRIYINKSIATSGYSIDYPNGEVVFSDTLTAYDFVNADYNFKWFADIELDRFLSNGIHKVNSFAPVTFHNINTMPDRHIVTVLYAAAVDAIRSLLFSINFHEPSQFFGGYEQAMKVFSNFEALKKNYEEQLMELLKQKKLGPYTGLTRGIVVPEFTLPGGRSRWFRYLFSGSGS